MSQGILQNNSNNMYDEYVAIEKQIELLIARKEQIRETLLKDFITRNVTSEITPFGRFTRVPYKRWVYSDAVKKLSDKVKIAQSKEQKSGKATCIVSESIRFTPKDNE